MILKDKIILLTGAGGGIGLSFVRELMKRGVSKIYAADINIESLQPLKKKFPGIVHPYLIDITNTNEIDMCLSICDNTDVLINNAGIKSKKLLLDKDSVESAITEMSINYFSVHRLCVAFWDLLKKRQNAAIVNILSIASIELMYECPTYCASKTAAHVLTESLRKESSNTNIEIYAAYPGYVNTEMTKHIKCKKVEPEYITHTICDAIERKIVNVFF